MTTALFRKKATALVLTIVCLMGPAATAEGKGKAADPWVEQKDVKLSPAVQLDGDSFGLEVKTIKGNKTIRTYRLYGTDCPESDEKDKLVEGRIREQAGYFGCKVEAIPALGKQAAEFTRKLLTDGKPILLTRGKMGQEVPKNPNRPQRYYALVKVTAPDGKCRMLHELLLEAGLARAHGEPAAWPVREAERDGKTEARKNFMGLLERIERAAKGKRVGAWGHGR